MIIITERKWGALKISQQANKIQTFFFRKLPRAYTHIISLTVPPEENLFCTKTRSGPASMKEKSLRERDRKKKKPPVFQYYLKQKTGSLVLPGSLNPTGKQAGRKQHLPLEPRRRKLSHSTSWRNDRQPVWMFMIDGQDLVLCRRFLIYAF